MADSCGLPRKLERDIQVFAFMLAALSAKVGHVLKGVTSARGRKSLWEGRVGAQNSMSNALEIDKQVNAAIHNSLEHHSYAMIIMHRQSRIDQVHPRLVRAQILPRLVHIRYKQLHLLVFAFHRIMQRLLLL